MHTKDLLTNILYEVQKGHLSIEEAKERLKTYEDLGFANVDLHRKKRTGFPEVIYGEGKTADQIIKILERLAENQEVILVTRIEKDKAKKVLKRFPAVQFDQTANTLFWKLHPIRLHPGYIAVVCAGTSDLPVAKEAAITAEAMGSKVELICDVGVAGLHRLIQKIDVIRDANVIIVVAGMEGALPSVIGGLVPKPIIAVPTSIGYGANFHGLSSLLSMLNACSNGISVVNIDNGFGAGYQAGLINKWMDPTYKGE